MSQFIFDAIGTHWVIDIDEILSTEIEILVRKQIDERISAFDKAYSRFREDSWVTVMSREKGRYELPEDAEKMMSLYKKMYDITTGLMTPMIGQVLVDAGYDATYSLTQAKPLTRPLTWDEAITYNHPHIDVHIPVLLDFGACGKGYLVDLVGEVLEKNNIHSFCVDAGGDMVYRNTNNKPLIVGMEHPSDFSKVIGTVSILNQSICGSAGNRRSWGDFHHIINPDTLISPRHMSAVWVTSSDTITADALTTALFFVSPEVLSKHFAFEYCILNADYSFEKSKGFNAEIFS